jgi:DNA (cytosine-5)-methyltransferase 1
MKFIDLFAGLGGFHIALEELGHECVFASEKKEVLSKLYLENFGINPDRDITKVNLEDVPKHDILCAGFPCQPFSKAGNRKGLKDKLNGNLFESIAKILAFRKPTYFILENVRNLEKHDNQNTWKHMKSVLEQNLEYTIDKKILSPHNFGIPQHRERIFIVGSKKGLDHFKWPKPVNIQTSIFDYLDKNPVEKRMLEVKKREVLNIWQNFIDAIPSEDKMPSWPIWSMEFGATYPFEESTPFNTSAKELAGCRGRFGKKLRGQEKEEMLSFLPNYARTPQEKFPSWKKHYIKSNRIFYKKYKNKIDPIVRRLKKLEMPSWQKLEWNIQGGERNLRRHIIQFRGSGVRIKKTNFFPSLVTVSTQIPILGFEERYITPREGARIQSLNGIKLPENIGTCFSALGNAVNAKIITLIAEKLIEDGISY